MINSLSILHIMSSAQETSAPYHEHVLPLYNKYRITICTLLETGGPIPSQIAWFAGDGSFKGFLRALWNACRDRKYDIIHVHIPHAGLPLLAFNQALGARLVPDVVYTVHSSYPNYHVRNKLMLLPVFAFFQTIVFCSRSSQESFPQPFRRLASRKAHVVQNGVNLARIDQVAASRPVPNRPDPFTVIFVGHLTKIKNPLEVLTAFQQIQDRDSHLLFVGDGPLRPLLLAKSAKLGLADRVQMTGMLPRPAVYERLTDAALFVSASRGEGLPVAVLEAMACRCPVVLSDIPPHREIAQEVDFIPLIQVDDVTGLVREIRRFRDMPGSQREEIGKRCRSLVAERFDLEAMHRGYAQVYARVLAQRSDPIEE